MDFPLHSPAAADPFPVRWNPTIYASNPVIDVANNPGSTTEQYTPSPIQLANGDIWVYVKGSATTVYAWKSTDGGVTFSLQNSGSAVLTAGAGAAWDSKLSTEPTAVYDEANDTIHLYYRGSDDASLLTDMAVGHATASGSNPVSFTKDAGNPILTAAAIGTDLGGGTVGSDLSINDVIKIGSTYHFYGTVVYNSSYRLFHATGTTWNNPSGSSVILTAPVSSGDTTVVQYPSVFSYGSGYGMIYTQGGAQPAFRALRFGASTDGSTWSFSGDNILTPTQAWDIGEVYAARLLKSSTSPFAAPVVDGNGRWKIYFSGTEGTKYNSGLAYLVPS